ncbi:DNA polymerase III subunit epsilon [Candidatus Photodesmus blepharus]|uniref:DNA polymerase III subunit epsilon n=1 Tax=Candidatus Photodesmus blepharonis TaxID=1179155 RepID=A0A084CNH5_9GAMM|nr:DNA polymerase III subunit epsilon [Candidatus Photodesmus blepharus]KEY91354.1 DNA polymerase III subunit epsilon [Candidatus Photodesmus blepharus]
MNARNNSKNKRVVVLDTETTGINKKGGAPCYGHRIIEIGAIEIINRKLTGRYFHVYIKPNCVIQPESIEVHGITNAFLSDKPEYHDIHEEFLEFIKNSELVAHNAPFDISFIDHEFLMLNKKIGKIIDYCEVTDTLEMAKKMPKMPTRKNLNSLAKHYALDISTRTFHGALLDAKILAGVYLAMTGGQSNLQLTSGLRNSCNEKWLQNNTANKQKKLKILYATTDEIKTHKTRLDAMKKTGACLWGSSGRDKA